MPAETRVLEELAHRRGRDRNAQPAQLADDALVAPARILAGQAQHQLSDLAADRRPTDATGIGPAAAHQPPMPAKQRRRCDDKRPPARSRQQPAGGSKEDSIGRPQPRPSNLTAQHRQLVAKHHDLQLLELLRAKTQRRELQHASKHDVAERPQQRPAPPWRRDGPRLYGSEGGTELTHPTRWRNSS